MGQFQEKEKYTGELNHKVITFNRVWSTHRFTDEECANLLAGNVIEFEATSKQGKPYKVKGKLEQQEYNGHTFYGFKPDFTKSIPDNFNGHNFTEAEIKELKNGKIVYVTDLVSKKSGSNYSAYLRFDDEKGMQMSFVGDEE